MDEEDIYNLICALRSRTTPEAHSAGILPINHLTIKHWYSARLRDDQDVAFKYELGQLVPNLIVIRVPGFDYGSVFQHPSHLIHSL